MILRVLLKILLRGFVLTCCLKTGICYAKSQIEVQKEIEMQKVDAQNQQNTQKEEIVLGNSPDEDFFRDVDIEFNKKIQKSSNSNQKTPQNNNVNTNNIDFAENIKNDITITKPKNFSKPNNTLAKNFETDEKNFVSEKNSLEQDKGYFINKKQAIDEKKIPKYPDRGDNKGLVGDLFGILNNKNNADKSSIENTNKKQDNKQSKDSFDLDNFINETDSKQKNDSDNSVGNFFTTVTSAITKKISDIFAEKKQEQPAKQIHKDNLANKYPDPTFFKIKKQDYEYKIPVQFLNDKKDPKNDHIPLVDEDKDYKILYLLFQKIKTYTQNGEILAMLEYIQNKNLVNIPDEYGNTLLNYSVRFNNSQSFNMLINYGANPNICNNSGICPIHIAIFNHQNYFFDILLKVNAKVDIKDKNESDAMLYSIYGGNLYAFLKLIDIPPYVNMQKNDLQYLLGIANDSENYEIYLDLKRRVEDI